MRLYSVELQRKHSKARLATAAGCNLAESQILETLNFEPLGLSFQMHPTFNKSLLASFIGVVAEEASSGLCFVLGSNMPFELHQTHTEIATNSHIIAALHSLEQRTPSSCVIGFRSKHLLIQPLALQSRAWLRGYRGPQPPYP